MSATPSAISYEFLGKLMGVAVVGAALLALTACLAQGKESETQGKNIGEEVEA